MTQPTVFVVDDDAAVRSSLGRMLKARGYRVEAYASATEFLESGGGTRSGCLVLDVRMPNISGLELQEHLRRMGSHLPVIFVTGHGDIPTTVEALKRGALDFLEKPYRLDVLVERIEEAMAADARARRAARQEKRFRARLERLTDREREVFERLTSGRNMSNRDVAESLGISHRTVEVHRARVMHKLEAESMADLKLIAASFNSGDPARRR